MSTINLPLIPGTLPEGYCLTTLQQFYNDMFSLGHAEFTSPGLTGQFNFGSSTPDPANRIYPWLSTNDPWEGWYVWNTVTGAWQLANPYPGETGDVVAVFNNFGTEAQAKAAILLIGLYDADTTNPFWRLCDGTNGTPDLRGRVVGGSGAGGGLTARGFNVDVGEEAHTQLAAELAAHVHPIKTWNFSNVYNGGAPAKILYDLNYTPVQEVVYNSELNTPAGTPFNVMQPTKFMWWKVRTGRRF